MRVTLSKFFKILTKISVISSCCIKAYISADKDFFKFYCCVVAFWATLASQSYQPHLLLPWKSLIQVLHPTTSSSATTGKNTTGITFTPHLTITNDRTTTSDLTTTTASNAISDNNFVAFFNQALSYIDSASIYIQPISNIIFGFMLVKMFIVENDRGCKLPTGLRVENGWHELSTDCQEECFCMKNEFYCRSKPCDLNENQCVLDAFGYHFCYPIDSSGNFYTECSCENFNCTVSDTIITPDTTVEPNTTIAPSFVINRVIDIAANQQVGTIENYYQNYEFSLEARV